MIRYFDSQNYISSTETAPDGLRVVLGKYFYKHLSGQISPTTFSQDKIISPEITPSQDDPQMLFPVKTQRIFFYGSENDLRDQTQWNSLVSQTVSENQVYFDHHYLGKDISTTNRLNLCYHDSGYEDLTKVYDTNLLINHNLLNYKHNSTVPAIKDIAPIRTADDALDYNVDSSTGTRRLVRQYEQRINNYTGSLGEYVKKQRNIFILDSVGNGISSGSYPAHFSKHINYPYPSLGPAQFTSQTNELIDLMRDKGVDKFIFQFIKNNLAFQNQSFYKEDTPVTIKTHDFTDMLLTNDLANFIISDSELFLLNSESLESGLLTNRFINRLNIVRFFSDYRSLLRTNLKNIEQIFDCESCRAIPMGYKIEKYLDRESTTPTQTFYTNNLDYEFIDTQLKYGRKYIYKTVALVAVFGSSYEYSNLTVSQESGDLMRTNGEIVNEFAGDLSKKYKAYVDVKVSPSLQILEVPIDTHETVFQDQPILPPQVSFHNESGRNHMVAILRPNLNSRYDANYSFQKLTEAESQIEELLSLSADNIYGTVFSSDYFTGIYEVYRMESPPSDIKDFANHFLTEVDMDAKLIFQGRDTTQQLTPAQSIANIRPFSQNNQVAHFEDNIVLNKKYYYIFRAKTYHGTPSNPTAIYQVELQSDSDETKLDVSEYRINPPSKHVYRRSAKRLLKIVPNAEHLIFSGDETGVQDSLSVDNLGILSNKLLSGPNSTRTFKIRITSKHTGKKMDINLTVKLNDKTN